MKYCEGENKEQHTDYVLQHFIIFISFKTPSFKIVVNMKCIVSVMKFYEIAKFSLVSSYLRLTIFQRSPYTIVTQSGIFV